MFVGVGRGWVYVASPKKALPPWTAVRKEHGLTKAAMNQQER